MRFKVSGRAIHEGGIDLATYESTYANLSIAVRQRAQSEPEFESFVGSQDGAGYIRAEWLLEAPKVIDAQARVAKTFNEAMASTGLTWPKWSVLTEVHLWPRGLEWDD
jgi:hypothetical protein